MCFLSAFLTETRVKKIKIMFADKHIGKDLKRDQQSHIILFF